MFDWSFDWQKFTERCPWWRTAAISIVIVVAVAGSCVHTFLNPEHAFWGMIENSLQTNSVEMQIVQKNGAGSLNELTQVQLGSMNRARSLTVLTQGSTTIKTETIGTPTADYTRYASIKTDQAIQKSHPLNQKAVIHVWAKSDSQKQSANSAAGNQLFSQAVLGVGLPVGSVPVPIGNFSAAQRDKLIAYMQAGNVYDMSLSNVKKQWHAGHLLYNYNVRLQVIPYVRLMQLFAGQMGLQDLDQVDPNTYQTAQPLQVKLTVDALSRQLVKVENVTLGYTQTYQSYGLEMHAPLPKNTVSLTELQKRLSSQ